MTRRWLVDLPTRIHLWTAEQEIRRRPSADPERLRNLEVLREYRKSRAFPRNDTGLRSTPYFVDRGGRHCAVGHLMRMSGDEDAVRRIAAEANLARIDDMDPAVLADWTQRSGLSKRELARIQPTYPNEYQPLVDLLLHAVLLMIPYALLSFVLDRIHLDRVVLRRGLVVATLVPCTAWSLFPGFGVRGELETSLYCVALFGPVVGAVAIALYARHGQLPPDGVAPVSGVVTGGLMVAFATAYLVLDVVVPEPSAPTSLGRMGDREYPAFWSGPALLALVLGLMTLVWAAWRLRRSIAESRA